MGGKSETRKRAFAISFISLITELLTEVWPSLLRVPSFEPAESGAETVSAPTKTCRTSRERACTCWPFKKTSGIGRCFSALSLKFKPVNLIVSDLQQSLV